MGSIARMDQKPPSSCWYMSKPSPQPIGQNRVFKLEMPGPPLKMYDMRVVCHYNSFCSLYNSFGYLLHTFLTDFLISL